MSRQTDPSKIRSEISSAINRIITVSGAAQQPCVTDAMVYGKRFCRPEIFGVDFSPGGDAFSFTTPIGNHVCDLIIALRYGDVRVGVFLPNGLLQSFFDNFEDFAEIDFGSQVPAAHDGSKRNDRGWRYLESGFFAYPSDSRYPMYRIRRHQHGVYIEYFMVGAVNDVVCDTLSGHGLPQVAADAVAHAAIHIIQSIGACVHEQEYRQKILRGMGEFVEFRHRYTSSELIRTYGIEPSMLEIVEEAQSGAFGEYRLHFMEDDKADLALFLQELEEQNLLIATPQEVMEPSA